MMLITFSCFLFSLIWSQNHRNARSKKQNLEGSPIDRKFSALVTKNKLVQGVNFF